MKILITTYGTLGDVQPYVALGKGLQKVGHQVIVGTSERYRVFVESHGLKFGHMSDALLSIIDSEQGKAMLESTTNIVDVIRQNIKLGKQLKPLQRDQLLETCELVQSVEPDFLIYHPKTGAAPHIAEKLDIGCALVTPIPMLVPTSEWAFPVLPNINLGGWYNRLSYTVISGLTRIFIAKYIKNLRHEISLKPLTKFDLLKTGDGQDIPVLNIVSQSVIPRPTDWPANAYMTGYCFLDKDISWEVPSDLIDFIEAGPPPVYVGFGSMAGRNPQLLAEMVIEALTLAKVRGIVATGWGGLNPGTLPDSIFKICSVPHDWLFPRVSAIVHHGGAGTTAAGLRAGKPSVIVPFFGDQPFWGRLLHSLGVGTKPVPRKRLSADKLAKAIEEAVSNPELLNNAELIGKRIRQEDGVSSAVHVIEKVIKDKR